MNAIASRDMLNIAKAGEWSTVREIEDLIDRVARGDGQAFSLLYKATHAKLFITVLAILNDRTDTEDVVQNAYIKIWRYADRYSANGISPMTWMITIARNTAIDRKRPFASRWI